MVEFITDKQCRISPSVDISRSWYDVGGRYVENTLVISQLEAAGNHWSAEPVHEHNLLVSGGTQ